jgi:hypothetical protein
MKHVSEVWNSAWTNASWRHSATLEWYPYKLKGGLDAQITATRDSVVYEEEAKQSRLHLPNPASSKSRAIFTRCGISFTTLEVFNEKDTGLNTRKQLAKVVRANAPHLQSITFHGISAAAEVTKWFAYQTFEPTFGPESGDGMTKTEPHSSHTLIHVKDVRFIDCEGENEIIEGALWVGDDEKMQAPGCSSDG